MMDKCRIAAFVLAAGAAALAHGSYLYWQIGGDYSASDATVATLWYSYDGGEAATVDEEGWSGIATRGDELIGPYQADISMLSGDKTAYSFFVELTQWTISGGVWSKTGDSYRSGWTWSYNDLADQGYIFADNVIAPSISPMAVNFSQPAPEPTSGMLMLLGISLLALKRRSRRDGLGPAAARGVCAAVFAAACAVAQAGDWMTVELATGKVEDPGWRSVGEADAGLRDAKYRTTHMAMRRVSPGSYLLQKGNVRREVTREYWIGVYPVTEAQYAAMAGGDAQAGAVPKTVVSYSRLRGGPEVPPRFGEGLGDGPLAALSGRTEGFRFDLPTECMWEVAARGAEHENDALGFWESLFNCGEVNEGNLGEFAWFAGNIDERDASGAYGSIREVGQKRPNPIGLYDVFGNVAEWCLDSNGKSRRSTDALLADAPLGGGEHRICRGGTFVSDARGCMPSARGSQIPTQGFPVIGFRLAAIAE